MRARAKKPSGSKIHLLHPLESLGLVHIGRGEVRVEPLQDRIVPRVPFPHRHDFVQLVVIEKGRGWHEIDFNRYKVKASQAYLIKPGQVHGWSLVSAKGFVVEFTHETIEANASSALPDCFDIDAADIFPLLRLMQAEFRERQKGFELNLVDLLRAALRMLERRAGGSRERGEESLALRFQSLVDGNFRSERRVEFYADRLKLTPKALTMRMTRALGKSAREVILDRVLLESKRMLAYSEASVVEIAEVLGFEDANYFSRFFRESAGASPSVFREKAKRP